MSFRPSLENRNIMFRNHLGRLGGMVAIALLSAFLTIATAAEPATASLPEPSPSDLPQWRGFNLLEKFHLDWSNGPYLESDFKMISEFGFNFVRLPMDYRVWIHNGDWNEFDESALGEIDQAVRWGQKYSIHVCINFHRAPGYTVASPAEPTNLWSDPETQRICAKHWAEFARRYKDVPNRNLSFNLFNEPAGVEAGPYLEVVKKMVAAIREHDPDRLILSDGLEWGREPLLQLKPMGVAQATRGYTPMEITHYRANWVSGSDRYPAPKWPRTLANAMLYAPSKSEIDLAARRPLRIQSNRPNELSLRFRVGTVSSKNTLVVRADDEVVWEKTFEPGAGTGEWKSTEFFPQWNSYQAVYDREYTATMPPATRTIELQVTRGDWLSVTELAIVDSALPASQAETSLQLQSEWAVVPADLRYVVESSDSGRARGTLRGSTEQDKQWLYENSLARWVAASEAGVGVMVGEFGCYNQTPHDVTLAWMKDNLAAWRQAGFGWALWNFRGSFGVMDSGRNDVTYERYQGHRLDRKMLELLQSY